MNARAGLLVLAVLSASCGGGVAGSPPGASPTAQVPASPTTVPSPTALTSAKGFITVRAPLSGDRVTSPLTISGDASVFEATLQWRVVDGGGHVFAEGVATASAGAPATGSFSVSAAFAAPAADTTGAIEVYSRSPKDGQIDDIVRVPVVIAH